jgi:hypothetical protein
MSDDKVVALATKRAVNGSEPPRINDEAIALLESMLKRARTGEVTSVAIAATTSDEGTMTSMSATENLSLLIGAAAVLLHRCMHAEPRNT